MSRKTRLENDYLTRQKQVIPKPKPVPKVINIEKIYLDAYKYCGIVCNNTVSGGGDCHGDTMCLCKETDANLYNYYKRNRKDTPIIHTDYRCIKCNILICACCYFKCPICRYHTYRQVSTRDTLPDNTNSPTPFL